jgi:protein gp37
MNKTSIEWCDYTWNPVTGCLHGCSYCYARKIAERFKGSKAWPRGFEPMFHAERLNDPTKMKKPQTIFVCSMADLFGEWVPDLWIHSVFDEIWKAPHHTYIFLTKNPDRYLRIPGECFKKNCWFGTTVTCDMEKRRIETLQKLPEGNKFISFEPLLGKLTNVNLDGIEQVIIGAQTNPSVEVTQDMILPLGKATCPGSVPSVKMFCKDSMPAWVKCRRELAWGLHK